MMGQTGQRVTECDPLLALLPLISRMSFCLWIQRVGARYRNERDNRWGSRNPRW